MTRYSNLIIKLLGELLDHRATKINLYHIYKYIYIRTWYARDIRIIIIHTG